MSRLDYSKWDKIELSDDEDIECHPNIDKASWVRLMQRKIHEERAERKRKIANLKAEHETNTKLREMILEIQNLNKDQLAERSREYVGKVLEFEKARKQELLDPKSEQFMKAKDVDEVFIMLLSRLFEEKKVEKTAEKVALSLSEIMKDELPKLDKRQKEVLETIAKEEAEQSKKLTSENIGHEGFSKTIINSKSASSSKPQNTQSEAKKEKAFELLNPGYESVEKKAQEEEGELRELSKEEDELVTGFSKLETFEDSFKYIQAHPEIVSKEYSNQLMARAFQLQMANQSKQAKKCAKWSLALNYSLQMGNDGVGLFYRRMINQVPEAIKFFEDDLEKTFAHIKARSKVLAEKKEFEEIDTENSNLTPEEAKAFKTFPKHFQEALLANDMEKINESFAKMGKEESERVMAECQRVGLIKVLDDDEAKQVMDSNQ